MPCTINNLRIPNATANSEEYLVPSREDLYASCHEHGRCRSGPLALAGCLHDISHGYASIRSTSQVPENRLLFFTVCRHVWMMGTNSLSPKWTYSGFGHEALGMVA